MDAQERLVFFFDDQALLVRYFSFYTNIQMKILHVIDSGGLYGAEIMLLHMAQIQREMGLDVTIASIGEHGVGVKEIEQEAINTNIPVKMFRMKPGLNIRGAIEILNYCYKKKIDIIHSHGYKGNIILGIIPSRLRRIPVVSTLHGWTSTKAFTKMALYEFIDACVLNFIDAVVLVNKAIIEKPQFRLIRRNNKIHVIENGIPLSSHESAQSGPTDSEILSFCEGSDVIGAIGRYAKEKGFDILIEAFHLVKQKHANARLLIIGEGVCRTEYERIVKRHHLEDSVMLAGYRADAWRYLEYMKLLAISSRTEGLPITLLEAMRARVPVVATRVGGLPNVIANGKTGWLVHVDDPFAFAHAIEMVLSGNANVEKVVNSAYSEFKRKYTVLAMSEKYYTIYNSLAMLMA